MSSLGLGLLKMVGQNLSVKSVNQMVPFCSLACVRIGPTELLAPNAQQESLDKLNSGLPGRTDLSASVSVFQKYYPTKSYDEEFPPAPLKPKKPSKVELSPTI